MKKNRRDLGIEAGEWLVRQLLGKYQAVAFTEAVDQSAKMSVDPLEYEAPPGYRTTEGSPRQSSSRSQSPRARSAYTQLRAKEQAQKPQGVQKAFTRQVILIIVGFGLLA